jgi:hypothetical protein
MIVPGMIAPGMEANTILAPREPAPLARGTRHLASALAGMF